MWAREFSDLFEGLVPYYLLFALPVFIIISPINPVEAASELDVHRLAHFELGGTTHGSKQASLTMDARGPSSSHVLRKTVVAEMHSLSVARLRELLGQGMGGLLLLLPPNPASLQQVQRESMLALEEELLNSELEVPVYFAEETPELAELYTTLLQEGSGSEAASSAFSALTQSVSNSGYQLVVSTSTPQPIKEQGVVSLSGTLPGSVSASADSDNIPSILVVAHYDSAGAAPGLAQGADSNGSGVGMLLELARMFSSIYSSSRSHPPMSLVFLLSGGGKINYSGTKRWLEEHLDMDTTSDVLANVDLVLCLDSLAKSSAMKLHVSKPPKEGSAGDRFLKNLESVTKVLHPEVTPVQMVHKKINLGDSTLAWEHERFSIRRLPAFTLSALDTPLAAERATILDTEASEENLATSTRLVGEALACSIFPRLVRPDGVCSGEMFSGSLTPSKQSMKGWMEMVTAAPRHTSLTAGKNSEVVKSLGAALSRYTHDVSKVVSIPDKREPEYMLYDTPTATMNVYRVKPAVFDLFLSAGIGCYLAIIYLILNNSSLLLAMLSGLLTKEKETEEKNGYQAKNGHANGIKNGHRNGHAF